MLQGEQSLAGKDKKRHPSLIIKAKRLPNVPAAIRGGPTMEQELISRMLSKTQREEKADEEGVQLVTGDFYKERVGKVLLIRSFRN